MAAKAKKKKESTEETEAEVYNVIAAFEQILDAEPNDRVALETVQEAYEKIGDQAQAEFSVLPGVANAAFDAPRRFNGPPAVDVIAAVGRDQRTLHVYAINRHPSRRIPVRWALSGFEPDGSVRVSEIVCSSWQAQTTFAKPNGVRLVDREGTWGEVKGDHCRRIRHERWCSPGSVGFAEHAAHTWTLSRST